MRKISEIIPALEAGEYDEILLQLYGETKQAGADREDPNERIRTLIKNLQEKFKRNEEERICLASSPGRAELIGNHMDHQGGCVLTGTLTLDMLGAAAKNTLGKVRIFSGEFGYIEADVADDKVNKEEYGTTKALVKGMIKKIRDMGHEPAGFDLVVDSKVPAGAGLSSSASFEMLTGVVINDLFCNGELTAKETAMAGQFAENIYFGKACGRMDQLAIGLGGVEYIDFENEAEPVHERLDISFEDAGYRICIIDTGTEHSSLTEEFDAIPGEMRRAAKVFGKNRLCEVDEDIFLSSASTVREICGDRAFMRGLHFYGERNRVKRQKEAIYSKDIRTFLKGVEDSGKSSFMYLQNVDTYKCPEREPVAAALAMAVFLLGEEGACRIHGGGFAGSVLVFVPEKKYTEFSSAMEKGGGKQVCRPLYIRSVGACAL